MLHGIWLFLDHCEKNARGDAIDIDHIDMPATPEKVWRAIREKRAAA